MTDEQLQILQNLSLHGGKLDVLSFPLMRDPNPSAWRIIKHLWNFVVLQANHFVTIEFDDDTESAWASLTKNGATALRDKVCS